LGTPALVATLMYDGTGLEHLPVHLYTDEYDAMEMLYEELDTSITEVQDNTTDDLVFNLSQDIINRAIFEAIREGNPDYAPGDSCTNDNECYITAEAQEIEGYNISFRLVGVWVSFYDGGTATDPGKFVLNVMAEIDIDGQMTYKTVLQVHMLFDDNAEEYYLAFDKIQIGNLPLPKSIFSAIINAAQNQGNIDIQGEVDANLPMGDFDANNISYTLQKDEILEQISESQEGETDATFTLMQELLSIIFDNNLIRFDLQDEEFVLTAGVSKFRSEDDPDFPEYLYDLHDQTEVDGEIVIGEFNPDLFDPEAYLKDVFTTYLFNSSLIGGGFEIEEEIFNKLIYSQAEGFANTRGVETIQVSETETKEIEIGLKAIWFDFEEEDIYVNALFKIAGIDSKLVIRAEDVTPEGVMNELKFEFTDITFGKDELENAGDFIEISDLEAFKEVFKEIGDVEFGEFNEDGDLVISTEKLSGLLQDGSEDGAVVVSAINLATDAIVLDVEASNTELQETLENFQAAIEDVIADEQLLTDLEGVLDTDGGGAEQEVFEAVEDIQAALTDPEEEVTPEQVEDLMENFEELDPETQTEFLETIGDLIDPELYGEFGDLFGDFDQSEEGTTEE
jgi:hypothetical protein